MSLQIGSTSIGSLYLGSTKIGQAYLGNVKVYESVVQLPAFTLRYKFYDGSFDPTTISRKGTWTRVSTSPNVWDWHYTYSTVVENTSWTYGPFAASYSEAKTVHPTGLYDITAAGDNTVVQDISYFFGTYDTEGPTGCTTNGPVNVCDLHVRPTGMTGLFRWCPTLEYYAGNIDISRCDASFASMYSHTSITALPPFTGMLIFNAGNDTVISFKYLVNDCPYLTSVANLNTIDLRFNDLSIMSVNDGLNFEAAFVGTPNLAFTGLETDNWNANAIPIRIFGPSSSTSIADVALSSNKVNLFKWRIRNACQFKNLFYGAGLTTVPDFTNFNYTNCDFTSCFQNNVNVTSGALAAYNKLSSLSATVGTDCFKDCGSNTQTGQADLDQIPQSWGGNYVVQDYYLGTSWSKRYNTQSYGTVWQFTTNIDFSVLTSMQIYTESSISAYAGVNMRKTNIGNKKGSFSTSAACYYWPCLVQIDSNSMITWYIRTQNYNGMLTSSQSSGDMSGTLSINTLGSMSVSGGTFDPNGAVRFVFVVTNTADASDIMSNFGFLYNANFYANPVIRVAVSTLTPANAYIGA